MAKIQKYKIVGLISITVGGENVKADKNGCFDLTEHQAKHLGEVYQVISVDEGTVMGDGKANLPPEADKAEISKETLMKLTSAELDVKLEALGIKADKDESKGDKAEKIMNFLLKLDRAVTTQKKK